LKSVKQNYEPSEEVLNLLDTFRMMTNDCVRIGLANNNASTLKRLSLLCYKELSRYGVVSYYKLHAISRAAGILASRKKSIRRGVATKDPHAVRPQLVSCYGFKVENGRLRVPLGERRYFEVPLNRHTLKVLSEEGLKVRSFTLTTSFGQSHPLQRGEGDRVYRGGRSRQEPAQPHVRKRGEGRSIRPIEGGEDSREDEGDSQLLQEE